MLSPNAAPHLRSIESSASPNEPESLEALFEGQPLERLQAGGSLFFEGDAASHVFAVAEGVLRIFKILSDGRRVITGFLYPGDLVGVSLRDRYLYSAEAVVATKVRRFGRNRFQDEIARCPDLRPQLFARICDEMAAAQDQMVLLARKSAEERVCSFLMLIARRMGCSGQPSPRIEIPMTRLDMADYLGLTIETVSRTMTNLTSRGVIEPTGRHTVAVRRMKTLAVLAGEGDDDEAEASYVRQAVWPH